VSSEWGVGDRGCRGEFGVIQFGTCCIATKLIAAGLDNHGVNGSEARG
jgi:hypothetical protein